MRDLVGIFFVDAVERKTSEARGLDFVEIGTGHEGSGTEDADGNRAKHLCMLAERDIMTFGKS